MNSSKRPQRGESPDNLPGQDGLPFGQDVADVQAGAVGGGESRTGPGVGRRTLAQRQRASAEAGRKLAEMGA